ncbi:MAG: hypothetical protein JW804_03140 [Sedimentisphaerales bacterium]|nr:hypothetical protein [Sedimentisphaerales bacterium]
MRFVAKSIPIRITGPILSNPSQMRYFNPPNEPGTRMAGKPAKYKGGQTAYKSTKGG